MWSLLRTRLPEAARAVAPLVGVVCLRQVVFVHASAVLFVQFLVGSALAIFGMVLLFERRASFLIIVIASGYGPRSSSTARP